MNRKSERGDPDQAGPFASLAPEEGFEPPTNRLTADRSTTELLRIREMEARTGIEPVCTALQAAA